ncbi:probable U3 small nucleolar RNA-associated protein 11 [Limulus polyphemus]|uniref:U3 small nucleolar RNA-associated protein 11 n=1 Tax=Limulus polyphemus TaxID=6850 RepID=A0ABM1B3F2_LIMPO|nr:probable U3 small nucleolar RNA-associated protein 11 [Limulus polyphemus]
MSSFRNAIKSRQKLHKERHQPASRNHLGILEKKKDYKARARDYQKKQNALKVLRKKALNKNPDEFYFHMINSQIEDGVHFEKEKPTEFTEEQLKLMQTQDLSYITIKRSAETKKIERLKATLHVLDSEERPQNKHTFFVDTKHEAKKFDVACHLGTHPALLDRAYNRPKLDTLKKTVLSLDEESLTHIAKEKRKQYEELDQRIQRERELTVLTQKMETKKKLMNSKDKPIKKIKDGTKDSAPIYLWKKERKR